MRSKDAQKQLARTSLRLFVVKICARRTLPAWEGKRKQKVESANKLLFSWFFYVRLVDVKIVIGEKYFCFNQ